MPVGTDPMRELEELRSQRADLYDEMQELNDLAETEQREFTGEEQRDYRSKERRFDQLSRKIDQLESKHDLKPRLTRGAAREHGEARVGTDATVRWSRSSRSRAPERLGREQRMADWASEAGHEQSGFTARDADDFSLGEVMMAMVRPEFRSSLTDVEQRALVEGTDASGGFLTPEPLSTNVIDRVRNAMVVMQAGATTIPLMSDKQSIARLTGGVTGAWRNENDAFNDTGATFDRVQFVARSYGFIVKLSEELQQDMVPGAGGVLENEFAQAAALELDRVALRGTGVPPQPAGVRNQSGVTIQSLGTNGATPTRYNELMTAVTTLLTANRQPTGVILSPRSSQFYGGLVDTTNQPLNLPRPLAELPFYVTANIPNNLTQGTSSDATETYVGYWPDLLIGIRLGVQLRLLQERYADTGQVAFRVHMRMDVQLQHPESFVVLTGVRP